MSLKLVSIASGSKGNATLIFSDTTAILVDAGISYTRLNKELRDFGLSVDMLDGVVITHEHSDHIQGLPRISKECKVYAHPLTARRIYERQHIINNLADVDNYEGGFSIGDIEINPFRVPHDAVYPMAYTFVCGNARASVATDIGIPTHGVMRNIRDSEVVLLEANHDIDMLQRGNYPFPIKSRILSDRGHLSNESAARIAQLLTSDSAVHRIVLGHISENNNTEPLAYTTVKNKLEECQCSEIELYLAHQDRRSEVFEIL